MNRKAIFQSNTFKRGNNAFALYRDFSNGFIYQSSLYINWRFNFMLLLNFVDCTPHKNLPATILVIAYKTLYREIIPFIFQGQLSVTRATGDLQETSRRWSLRRG